MKNIKKIGKGLYLVNNIHNGGSRLITKESNKSWIVNYWTSECVTSIESWNVSYSSLKEAKERALNSRINIR